ncbi:addiction module antidote protein [Caballeronia pedi]|uniref:addiction module antidote protein n=1 Tax=Caballeronia pedi TaxID=1777141 RepID=UPI0007723508|nr:addiction module antidote protein [Caballeronia pedi]
MTLTASPTFDAADYLDSEETIAEFFAAAMEDPNPNVFLSALGAVMRARGVAKVAAEAGLGRESLYKAIAPGAHPRDETIQKLLRVLGVRMNVAARHG